MVYLVGRSLDDEDLLLSIWWRVTRKLTMSTTLTVDLKVYENEVLNKYTYLFDGFSTFTNDQTSLVCRNMHVEHLYEECNQIGRFYESLLRSDQNPCFHRRHHLLGHHRRLLRCNSCGQAQLLIR